MSLPTLADLKAELNMTSAANDGELSDKLDAAVDVVEGIVGPITTRTVTETHRNVSGQALLLREMPATSLTGVSVRSYGSSTTPDVDDYELDSASGTLRLANGYHHYGNVTVTYSVGRPNVPAAIRQAVLQIAAHLWETQRGSSPSALALQQQDADFGAPAVAGYAIPNRAKDLLAPYARVPIA